MAKRKKKEKSAPENGVRMVARNKKARFSYHVIDLVEAGIVLTGTEVKSLRDGKLQLMDAYAVVEGGEIYLHHAHIGEYKNGNVYNHEPRRVRKLLMHRREIDRLAQKVNEKGLALIPLEVYFKNGRAKVTIGVCRGKAQYDKRATIRDRDERRSAERGLQDDEA